MSLRIIPACIAACVTVLTKLIATCCFTTAQWSAGRALLFESNDRHDLYCAIHNVETQDGHTHIHTLTHTYTHYPPPNIRESCLKHNGPTCKSQVTLPHSGNHGNTSTTGSCSISMLLLAIDVLSMYCMTQCAGCESCDACELCDSCELCEEVLSDCDPSSCDWEMRAN